jgi:hypothetical protein
MELETNYEIGDLIEEFRYSMWRIIWDLCICMLGIGFGLWMLLHDKDIQLLVLGYFIILFSLYFSVMSILKLLDREPFIRIYKNGLWIRKHEFIQWTKISKTETKISSYGRSSGISLNIYLKNSLFDKHRLDLQVDITYLEKNDIIGDIIIKNLLP